VYRLLLGMEGPGGGSLEGGEGEGLRGHCSTLRKHLAVFSKEFAFHVLIHVWTGVMTLCLTW